LTAIFYNIYLLLYQQTKIDASSNEGDKPQNLIGDIEFDNVVFTYPARKEAPVCYSNLLEHYMLNVCLLYRY
jgi:ABC-type multidrug transport system fused ATPase/permease subunit